MMNTVEAMQALIDGKKVRRTCWSKDNYAVVSSGCVVTQDGYKAMLACDGEWEIYDVAELPSFGVGEELRLCQQINARSVLMNRTATDQEITDTEDFIAKTSKPFEPADLFVGGIDGYVYWAGWGISIKNDIPVSLTVRDEIYDVVPKGKSYTPMTDDELSAVSDPVYHYMIEKRRSRHLPMLCAKAVERAVIERLGLVWGGE